MPCLLLTCLNLRNERKSAYDYVVKFETGKSPSVPGKLIGDFANTAANKNAIYNRVEDCCFRVFAGVVILH